MRTCFTGDTPLLVEGGSKRADEIREGDKLLSQDEHDPDGAVEEKVVEEVFVRVSPILNLHVGGKIIRTTGEHPFYVDGRGWVPAAFLEIGDLLQSHDKKLIPVEGVADSGEVTTVYNFRIADYHTYFVGSDAWSFSVWAHNNDYQRTVNADGSRVTREQRWLDLANRPNSPLPKEVRNFVRRSGGKGVRDIFGLELAHRPKRSNVQGHDYSDALPKYRADHNGIQHRYLRERATGTVIRIPNSGTMGTGRLSLPPRGALP